MNKFVERAWEQEDQRRGYTVYTGTAPKRVVRHQQRPWGSVPFEDKVIMIAGMFLIVMLIIIICSQPPIGL